jgi:hypothetical protein
MSLNRVVLSVVAVLSLGFLIACGSSSHTTPPPTGAFSNANLSGTYVFSIVGTESAGGDFLSITGAFSANGSGSISGGAIDFNDSDTGVAASAFPDQAVTGGSYNVTSDGRGQATLNTTTPWGANTLMVDFVLASSSNGTITQFDANGTGSGTLTLQSSAAAQPAAGNYVFALTGINGSGLSSGAIAGAVAVDGSGNITTPAGTFLDWNDNGNSQQCTITSGSITVTSTPGTASIATNCGTAYNFDVYEASANDYKVIETDQFPNFTGDLFLQTTTTLPTSGQIVFTMAGLGSNAGSSASDIVALGGLATVSGATLVSGEEDYDDEGTSNIQLGTSSTPQAFTGAITAPGTGSRYQLALSTFENGQGQTSLYTFAAYPYSSTAMALIEIDDFGISAGTAYVQSSTSLASAQGYGMNLTAINGGSGSAFEQDDIAEFTANNGSFSNAAIDLNDEGSTLFDKSFSGNYQMDSPATGRGEFTGNTPDDNSPSINLVFYTVSSTQTIFVEVDTSQLGVGTFLQQNASGSASDFTARHLAVLRAAKAMKAKKAKENK